VVTLHVAASTKLSAWFLQEVRHFLDAAFDGDFSDDDWAHAMGGLHVWASDVTGLISHGALVERTLVCGAHTLRLGYVEAMATAAKHRRQGHGSRVLQCITDLIRERYPLGALSTGSPGFYERLGWERWRGPTFVATPEGRRRTPDDDGGIMILRTSRSPDLNLDDDIVCDWRPGDVW
jgi:aminoglycoside 2'-N-acetyltransferase I